MPLSLAQKKYVLKKIRQTSEEAIYTPLKQLIKKGVKLPIIGETSPLKELIQAYEAVKALDTPQDEESYAKPQLNIIKRYLKATGCSQLMDAFMSDSLNAASLSDEFLEYFATYFDWSLTVEPSVKLTIVAGKVYWRIIQNDDILYDNADAKGNDSSQFFNDGKTVTITMSWANFRRFKDAGKRTSSVEITKERFRDECNKLIRNIEKKIPQKHLKKQSVVSAIWNELKEKGLLSDNDRLTHAWYSLSGDFCLDYVNDIADQYAQQAEKKEVGFLHTYTSKALNNASTNHDYRKVLPGNFEIFRPARTLRGWKSTGKLSYPFFEEYPVQQWDVGSYLVLKKHEKSGDELQHDHIPSKCCIKADLASQYKREQLKTEHYNEEKEYHSHWGCIEVPEDMHTRGKTHCTNAKKQSQIEKPFYEEFNYYMNEVMKENLSPQDLIEVIGAFRYLFSCHIKEKFTTYSHGFFSNKPKLVHDIDTLLLEKLSQVSAGL